MDIHYEYDGKIYFKLFPLEYAMTHIPLTGPKYCGNCNFYGNICGGFALYCNNCAFLYDSYERGYGIISSYFETTCVNNYDINKSAFNTYLKDINFYNLVKSINLLF